MGLIERLRLVHQQAYMINGQKLYDGIWNPGAYNQVIVWGWNPEDFEEKEEKLYEGNLRLVHQQVLVIE